MKACHSIKDVEKLFNLTDEASVQVQSILRVFRQKIADKIYRHLVLFSEKYFLRNIFEFFLIKIKCDQTIR